VIAVKLQLYDEQGASPWFPAAVSSKKSEGREKYIRKYATRYLWWENKPVPLSKMVAHHVPPGQSAEEGSEGGGQEQVIKLKKKISTAVPIGSTQAELAER